MSKSNRYKGFIYERIVHLKKNGEGHIARRWLTMLKKAKDLKDISLRMYYSSKAADSLCITQTSIMNRSKEELVVLSTGVAEIMKRYDLNGPKVLSEKRVEKSMDKSVSNAKNYKKLFVSASK